MVRWTKVRGIWWTKKKEDGDGREREREEGSKGKIENL